MNRVVIINDRGQNFQSVRKFGIPTILTNGMVNLGDIPKLIFNIKHKIEELKVDDVFVLTGPSLLVAIVAVAYLNRFPKMTILALSRTKDGYKYRTQTVEAKDLK